MLRAALIGTIGSDSAKAWLLAHAYLFADEAGDFAFNARGSRFFIIGSVTMASCAIGNGLLNLRRELTLRGRVDQHFTEFHAAEDRQEVRDRVFMLLGAHDLVVASALQVNRKKAVLGHKGRA